MVVDLYIHIDNWLAEYVLGGGVRGGRVKKPQIQDICTYVLYVRCKCVAEFGNSAYVNARFNCPLLLCVFYSETTQKKPPKCLRKGIEAVGYLNM